MNRREALQRLAIAATILSTGVPALAGTQTKPPRRVFRVEEDELVEIEFLDLKKGDRFLLYEPTGELVVDTQDPAMAWEAQEDAYLKDGVGTVYCEPVKDTYYDVPRHL